MMVGRLSLVMAGALAVACLGVAGCDYGRMYDQDSVRTYGARMPSMDGRAVPSSGGINALTAADPGSLKNPLPHDRNTLARGMRVYQYFCQQCHGPGGTGYGTVGQSFAPLPTDLASRTVQEQSDGALYVKILLGFKRHPKLFTSVGEGDAWAAVTYVRSLAGVAR